MIIGLTGGIGTGKSAASKELKAHGYEIIDADEIYAELTKPGMPLVKELADAFGDVLTEDGELDRVKLSNIALGNPLLNTITHKAISAEIEKRLEEYKGKNVVLDLPLLFESGYDKRCDEVWSIISTEEDRIKRILERGTNVEEIKRRMKLQVSDEERIKKSDVVIENYGTREEFIEKIRGLINGRS